jgi:murein DD-endopeptidase MepM/ murein hydrolase activator NlpD
MRFFSIAFLLFIACNTSSAQSFFPRKNYPRNSFSAPVRIPMSLAGNFGECRPNHFHSGLDVRTNKVENIPIYAIADGYISRVKIEAGGFGNAIYVTHKNGFTSLYAHLNLFYTELENHIRYNQYQQKSWKIDKQFLPHEFPISKGQFLAYSGNTGSSQAPHLHMEIRDTKTDKPLNGLLFYNLADTKAPLLKKLALYDGNKSIYAQSPKQMACIKKGNEYRLPTDTITINSNLAAFGLVADDPMENCLGVLGVYELNMFVDNEPYFGWQLDNIGYDETRYMNAMADYKTKKNGGPWIQLCYQQKGDKLNIYKSFTKQNGKVSVQDGKAHAIMMKVKDVNNNETVLRFWIKGNNTNTASAYDLIANKENKVAVGAISFVLPKEALYDDLVMQVSTTELSNPYSYLYKVQSNDIPVHSYFDLKLKPKSSVPKSLENSVAMVRYPYGKDKDKKGKAAKMENGFAVCSVRDFGNYELVIDQTAPATTCSLTEGANLKGNKISVTAKDETTSIQKFVGTIDGQWVRFVQKGNTFTYEVDKHCVAGKHQLRIEASDENGNTKTIQLSFTK